MIELDKRIAEEIMGERWIDLPVDEPQAWQIFPDEGGWIPHPFSSDWNYTMMALKQCKDMDFGLFLDPFLDGDDVFQGYLVEVGIAEGSINKDGYADSKVEKECNSLDDLPTVLCEAMLEYRGK